MSMTLKLGWTSALSGAFGDHPALGPVFDLNDGVTFTLATPDGLDLHPPVRTIVTAGNVRTRGERAIYRHNREVVAHLILGPMASFADLAANVRSLVAWLNAPPSVPFTVQYQPNGATLPVYLDVVACAHNIPEDEAQWLRLQFEPIEIVFVCRPGLRGDRVTLQNLVVNPGFEAPSGPAVTVFSDTFANTSAYTVQAGSAPSLAANVMTLSAGCRILFGAPWGAINAWRVRFQFATGLDARFYLHRTDASNDLECAVQGGAFSITQRVAGVAHTLASAAPTLVNGTFYWLQVTQFPSVAGGPPCVQATLYNDSAGSQGSQVVQITGGCFDAVTALTGQPRILANTGSLAIGGAFSGVHTLSLFGPGGWQFITTGTVPSWGVWDGSLPERGSLGTGAANMFPSGPATSFGAARIDTLASGTVDAQWLSFDGGSPAGQWAMPASAGDVLGVSGWVKSTAGLGVNCQLRLVVSEFDVNGSFLRNATAASVTGAHTSWTQLSATYTTGANCAYVSLACRVTDSNAGASANCSIWFDNVQLWDQTDTGMTSMPWCQLRMPQSPCEVVVSGLLGNLPAPALLSFGTYVSSLPTGGSLSFAVGRRNVVTASGRLVGPPVGFYGTALSPQSSGVLDASSYGGFFIQAAMGGGWNPRFLSVSAADDAGTYHLFSRFLSQQVVGNLPNVTTRVSVQQRSQAWFGDIAGFTDEVGTYFGPFTAPLTQQNVWTVVDSGPVPIPFASLGALTDPTQLLYTPRAQWGDSTGGGSTGQAGWQMLLPIDGSLIVGVLNNPSNGPFSVSTEYV